MLLEKPISNQKWAFFMAMRMTLIIGIHNRQAYICLPRF